MKLGVQNVAFVRRQKLSEMYIVGIGAEKFYIEWRNDNSAFLHLFQNFLIGKNHWVIMESGSDEVELEEALHQIYANCGGKTTVAASGY